jgi:hypothetical protein
LIDLGVRSPNVDVIAQLKCFPLMNEYGNNTDFPKEIGHFPNLDLLTFHLTLLLSDN